MNSHELPDLAMKAAVSAVEMISSQLNTSDKEIVEKSSPTDLVTKVDRASEEIIRNTILSTRPNDGFVGEEGGNYSVGDITWIVDPIDGTTNFVYGFPAFAVSIAAKNEQETLCSVVVDVYRKEYFTASARQGAFLNGRQIHINPVVSMGDTLVSTGFSYNSDRRVAQVQTLAKMIGRIRDIRRAGAASLDLAWMAMGRTDAYFESGLWPWDFEGGSLIAKEAGAQVGNLTGGPPDVSMTVAAHPQLFHEFTRLIVDSTSTP